MIELIVPIAQIQRRAIEAADLNDGPEANPYPIGSEAAKLWIDLHRQRVNDLNGEVTA